MIQSDITEYIDDREITGKYKQTSPGTIHLTMLKPYIFSKTISLDDTRTILNQEQLDEIVKEKLITLYDYLRMVERNMERLIDLMADFTSFQVKLAETELSLIQVKGKISADQLNDAVDVLIEGYYLNLFEKYFDTDNADIKKLQELDPFFLQLLLSAVMSKGKRDKRMEIEDEKTYIEYEDEEIKGEFVFRHNDNDYGYYMKIIKPFNILLPTVWNNSLSTYKTASEIKEMAEKRFHEVVAVIDYVSANWESCQKLFNETCQFWNALFDIQLDDQPQISRFKEFMIYLRNNYYQTRCDKYIPDNEDVKNILIDRGLVFLENILMGITQRR